MQRTTTKSVIFFTKVFLLSVFLFAGLPVLSYAASEANQAALAELKANQAKLVEAQAAQEAAQKTRDALAAQQASKPSAETERKLKDADYEVMMAETRLSSATKAVERAQKKLNDVGGDEKSTPPSAVKVEKTVAEPKMAEQPKIPVVTEDNKKVAEEQARKKEAEAKLAAQKASEEVAAKKAAEEQARKEAEVKLAAQQKASEEAAAKKAAEAAETAKKQALAAELGIDKNCIALPTAPTKPSASVNATEQAYAQGFLKQINLLVAKKADDDAPPLSPTPVLDGTKLSPCDPNQKLALKFGYMGNGQYRLETPVLAGSQEFVVKNVVAPVNREIPESDNGEVYVFFLDGREGRTKLSAYKKSLFEETEK